MRALPLIPLMLLFTAPAFAFDNTATVAGNPIFYDGPSDDFVAQGRLPQGATVTLVNCTADDGTGSFGVTQRHHNHGSFCLVRGAGWVDASFLVGMKAKVNVTDPVSIGTPPPGLFGNQDNNPFGSDFFGDPKPSE